MSLKINNIIADPLTVDPTTPTNGTIWYRSDLNKYFIRLNGVSEEIITTATVTDDQTASEVTYTQTTPADWTLADGSSVAATLDELGSRVSANDAKVTNVTTDLSIANSGATTLDVASSDGTDATIPAATTSLAGLLTGADKTKLDGIESGATADQDGTEVPYTQTTTSDWTLADGSSVAATLDEVGGRLTTNESNITTLQSDVSALTSGYSRREAVISIIADNTAVPPTEVSGDRYILAADGGAPNAAWDGASAGDIVEFNGTTWDAVTPLEGYVAYSDTDNKDALFVNDGTPSWELRSVATTDASGVTYTQTTTSDWTLADGSSVAATLDEVGGRLTTNETDIGTKVAIADLKSGVISAASFNAAGIATITFGTAFANTNYSVSVLGGDGNVFTYESKAVGSIDINANSTVPLLNDVMWIATAHANA
jgi:hypothetical protein